MTEKKTLARIPGGVQISYMKQWEEMSTNQVIVSVPTKMRGPSVCV